MSKPILYSYWRSSCSWRVRSALAFKKIDYEYRSIHIAPGKDEQLKPEFLEVNPLGQVPAMIIEHDGKKIELIQSIAIIKFLENKFPDLPKLLPSDPLRRYQVEMITDIICSGIQPLQNLTILHKFNVAKPGSGQEWAKEVISKGFSALEKILQQTSGKFCVGNEFTLADVCLVPQVYNATRFDVDILQFPLINKLASELEKHPAIQVSHPTKMPDAPAS